MYESPPTEVIPAHHTWVLDLHPGIREQFGTFALVGPAEKVAKRLTKRAVLASIPHINAVWRAQGPKSDLVALLDAAFFAVPRIGPGYYAAMEAIAGMIRALGGPVPVLPRVDWKPPKFLPRPGQLTPFHGDGAASVVDPVARLLDVRLAEPEPDRGFPTRYELAKWCLRNLPTHAALVDAVVPGPHRALIVSPQAENVLRSLWLSEALFIPPLAWDPYVVAVCKTEVGRPVWYNAGGSMRQTWVQVAPNMTPQVLACYNARVCDALAAEIDADLLIYLSGVPPAVVAAWTGDPRVLVMDRIVTQLRPWLDELHLRTPSGSAKAVAASRMPNIGLEGAYRVPEHRSTFCFQPDFYVVPTLFGA